MTCDTSSAKLTSWPLSRSRKSSRKSGHLKRSSYQLLVVVTCDPQTEQIQFGDPHSLAFSNPK